MKTRVGLGLVALSFLLACGSEPPPPPATPPPTPVASAPVAPTPPPTASAAPAEKPAEVFNFGKKAPAAGTKLTDKYTWETKDEKRAEERKIEVVTSDEKAITKAKVTLVSFEHTMKGKTNTPNKGYHGKTLTVEAGKDGKPAVTDDAGKTNNMVAKFVALRRPPRVGEPVASVAAFSERPLKVGDILEGEKIGMTVSELATWSDESAPMPATAKREFTGTKATLKSVEGGSATFDVTVKEKVSEGTAFVLDQELTGTIVVKVSDSLVSKADLKMKVAIKIKDLAGPGGKKLSMDVNADGSVNYQRAWE